MKIYAIIILAPFLLNFILLYNRKTSWAQSNTRWFVVVSLFISGLTMHLTGVNLPKIVTWSLLTPFMFSCLDVLARSISLSLQGRDLHLWLRGSNDIDDTKLSGGKQVTASDRILSLILLFTVLILPFLILFVKK